MWGLMPDMKEKEAQRGRRPSQEPHWPSREVGAMAAPGGACRVERPAQRPLPKSPHVLPPGALPLVTFSQLLVLQLSGELSCEEALSGAL